MNFDGKKVLITGGAGFIGRHLYEQLLTCGAQIIVFDSLSPQIHGENATFSDPRITFIRGDVRDCSALVDHLPAVDVVVHLAAETGTAQSMYQIKHYVDVNEIGTSTLLEAITLNGKKGVQFILASSRSIYGEGAYRSQTGEIVHPNSRSIEQLSAGDWELVDSNGNSLLPIATPVSLPPKPGSIYAATKYSQEMLVRVFCEANDIACSILRLQNVYGEGQSLRNPYTGIISIFYNRMRQGLPINIFEDGLESRDFVHVSDVVSAVVSLIAYKNGSEPVILNVGSGKPTTVLKLANLLAEVSGIAIPIEVSGNYRLGDIRHCYADTECARHYINFSPKIDLRKGLTRFVGWASQQPTYRDETSRAIDELSVRGLGN